MSFSKKGVLVTWELSNVRTTAELLSGAGFDKYLPSNGAKTALIKALKQYKKTSSDKIYRRWDDAALSAKFTVFFEEVQDNNLKMNDEATIELNKRTGDISLLHGSREAFEKIQALYDSEGATLNTDQFRQIIKNIISHDLHGFAARKGGGVYFIDERFREGLENLKKIFNMFPLNAKLHIIPVYNDEETLQVLEHHVADDLFAQIDVLIKDIDEEFKKGTINPRKLENRKEKASEILSTIAIHEENLRGAYETVKTKLESVAKSLDGVTGKVERGIQETNDFMGLLESI